MEITVPVSAGELIDKIGILRLKVSRVPPARVENVRNELVRLEAIAERLLPRSPALDRLITELDGVNAVLWDLEDGVRGHERRGEFGAEFVELARQSYRQNDVRAVVKRRINDEVGSEIVEEKSY